MSYLSREEALDRIAEAWGHIREAVKLLSDAPPDGEGHVFEVEMGFSYPEPVKGYCQSHRKLSDCFNWEQVNRLFYAKYLEGEEPQ